MATWGRRKHAARAEADAVTRDAPDTAIQAGQKLRDFLERKLFAGLITAVDLAIQSHYTTLCGGVGLEDLAVRPDQAEKHAASHIELILGSKYPKPVLKSIDVPACTKRGCIREEFKVAMRMPTEIISETYNTTTHIEPPGDDPSVLALFPNHPVVRVARAEGLHWSRIVPLVIYTDGVKYSTRDSFVQISITDYRTLKMVPFVIVRKDDMCKCGCRGWCTLFPILVEIAINLRDGRVAGFRIAAIMTKGDWPAFTEIAGVRQWFDLGKGKPTILTGVRCTKEKKTTQL